MPTLWVWGAGPYTDDSSVCGAAVHGGLITPETGGVVTIIITEGQSSYDAAPRNGVESSSYGSWGGSFGLAGAGALARPRQFPRPEEASQATAQYFAGGAGTQCSYGCPPGVPLYVVWGTGIYTDDSSVCSAAVHAGVIDHATGGWATIIIEEGQSSYAASTQNGVSSRGYQDWDRSFTFAGATLPSEAIATAVRFVREDGLAYTPLEALTYADTFFIEVDFDTAPAETEQRVALEWDGGTSEVAVFQTSDDPKLFRSEAIMLRSPVSGAEIQP